MIQGSRSTIIAITSQLHILNMNRFDKQVFNIYHCHKNLYATLTTSKNQTSPHKFFSVLDHSQTLVGALMQKVFIVISYLNFFFFCPQPSDLKKFQAPFLPLKLRVNPIEKHVYTNSIFTGKFVVIFFQGPHLTRVKNVKGPHFLHQPPHKCS